MNGEEHHPLRLVGAVLAGAAREAVNRISWVPVHPLVIDGGLVAGGLLGSAWHPGRESSVTSEGWLDGSLALLARDAALMAGTGGAV